MVYGKRKTKKSLKGTKRRYKRKRNGRANMVISRSSPIPDRFFTKLHYTELITLSYTGTLKTYQFKMNDIYDPNYTGTGHQPMGHDQFALLYSKYRVYGCRYNVIWSNTNATYQGEGLVQLRPNSTLSATFEDAMEDSYRQYRVLPCEGSEVKTINGYASVAKLYGVKKSEVAIGDNFAANIGASPNVGIYMNLYVQNQDVATALTVVARVNFTFFVEFYERKILGAS